MATHLVIGDPNCTPKASNERFLWAGRLAADVKATHIICMGDFVVWILYPRMIKRKNHLKVEDIKKIWNIHTKHYLYLIKV